jgi:thymidylate kinase
VPSQKQADDRLRAFAKILELLDGVLVPDGVHYSPLGIEWTDIFSVHVRGHLEASLLEGHGWLRLDGFFSTHKPVPDEAWGITEGGRVLAGLMVRRESRQEPVAAILSRARWQGEVRLREMLELRALRQKGATLPVSSDIVQAAADLENGLAERFLVRWTSGRRLAGPVPVRQGARAYSAAKFVIACSGVDGAGKTTLMDRLCDDVAAAGIRVTRVWLRPGMGLGWLSALATRGKRVMGQSPEPGFSAVAADEQVRLHSRRGLMGWGWSLLVTVSYLSRIRRQHAAARGVVVYDRHVLDALATMRVLYAGSDTRISQWLIRRIIPSATVTIYLDVPPNVAVARKPGDVVGPSAVRRQLDAYNDVVPTTSALVLDATRPVDDLASDALTHVVRTASGLGHT